MAKRKKSDESMSFDALVGSTTVLKSAVSTKKKLLPQIKLSTAQSTQLRSFLVSKKQMKIEEADMRVAEKPLLELCQQKQDEDALAGTFNSSYELVADDSVTTAKFISVDKFNLSQDSENIEALRELLGDDFDKEVVKTTMVMLKPEVFTSKELKEQLVKLVGKRFGEFFQSIVTYKMKAGFDERLYKLAGDATGAAQYRTICSKTKSTIK